MQKDVAWKAGFTLPRNELFTISRSSTTNELIVVCRPKYMDSFERWIKDSQEWRQAAQPQTQVEMHRAKATTKDPSGWYLAASTHGNFSVLIPVPFHDATGTHGTVTAQMVAAKTTGGIKFCASETPIILVSGYTNLASFPERFLKPDHTVSDIDTSPFAGYPSVSFSVKGPSNSKVMRFVETPKSLIVVILEYPNDQAKAAEGFRSTFLSSLKINKTESEPPEVNASSQSP